MHLIGWLCLCRFVVFFLELWSILSFGPHFFVSMYLLRCMGLSLRYSPGWGNPCCHIVVLYVGRSQRGNRAACLVLGGFQSLPLPPTNKLGHSGADSQVGGWVYVLGTCRSFQWTPVSLGVSPATDIPTGFYGQRFWGFLFPCWNPGLCDLSRSTVVPPSLSACKCGTTWPSSHHLAHPVLQGLPCCKSSLSWLPVSTPPTSLNECFFFNSLVVGLPYSSGILSVIFCFQICCCPSLGCARRHSVSTYASILAGSQNLSSNGKKTCKLISDSNNVLCRKTYEQYRGIESE